MRPGIALPETEERVQHLSAIRSISEKHRLPAEEIAVLYERELASLREGALVTSYLSIFVARRLDDLLRAARPAPGPAREAGAPPAAQ